MSRPSLLIRATTLTSSFLLVAGLIAYRAGAFHTTTHSTPSDCNSITEENGGVPTEGTVPAKKADKDSSQQPFLYSSKSMLRVITWDQRKDFADSSPPEFLQGTKSPGVIVPHLDLPIKATSFPVAP